MNAELARRKPATIVRQEPLPRTVDLCAPTKAELLNALRRRHRAGEVHRAGPIRLVTQGRLAGSYAVTVTLVPPRATDPRWAVLCRNAGIAMMGASALFGSIAWLLSAISMASLVCACGTVLVMFTTWVWAKYGRRGNRGVIVTTTVQMR